MGNGRSRPERLEKFRFTSSSKRALEAVAQLHGGEVKRWEGAPVGEQWELFTEASEIPVIVPPDEMALSQWYELWTGGGCKRRCDGETEQISDGPCLCDAEARECKPHSRLSLMLIGVAGVGLWRLDTQGWYASAELQGARDMAALLANATGRSILPGYLRVTARTTKRPDPEHPGQVVTRNYVVPTLDFEVDVAAVALAGLPTRGENVLALPAPATPLLASPSAPLTPIPSATPSLAEQLEAVENPEPPKRRKNSPPPLPRTGIQPRAVTHSGQAEGSSSAPSDEGEKEESPSAPGPLQTPALRKLHTLFTNCGIKAREDRMAVTRLLVEREVDSSTNLTQPELDTLITALEAHLAGKAHIFRTAQGEWQAVKPQAQQAELPS